MTGRTHKTDTKDFLPVSREDMLARGWDWYDILLVTGDAYVDHPSFGAAVIGRLLENAGYRVAVLAQPAWNDASAFAAMGRPELGVFIGAGNLDSMVAHYTAAKKRRSEDFYSPGRKAGLRPDRACTVYANRARQAFPGIPVLLGGMEASLRRFAHYDYWDDKVRRSVIFDARADILVYGMGESATLEAADRLRELDVKAAVTVAVGVAHGKALLVQAHDERALRNVAERVERIGIAVKGRVVRAEPLEREAVDRPVGREDLERGIDIHRRLIPVPKADAKLLRTERLDHAVAADRLAARCAGKTQRERKQQRRNPFCMLQGKPSQMKNQKSAPEPDALFIIPNLARRCKREKLNFLLHFCHGRSL